MTRMGTKLIWDCRSDQWTAGWWLRQQIVCRDSRDFGGDFSGRWKEKNLCSQWYSIRIDYPLKGARRFYSNHLDMTHRDSWRKALAFPIINLLNLQ